MGNEEPVQDERREHPRVRKIFVQACTLLAPMVQGKDNILRMSGFAMSHIVKNNFPELSGTEVQIVIATIERLQRESRLQMLLEK
jgi:hypothetical protein